jgi:autotransporter-associated beta strand protein
MSGTPNPAYNGGGAGGGGLGAGGDIFIQGGGKLKILGGSLGAGTVKGGSGANPGSAFGSGIFLQGSEAVEFAPTAGETLIIAGVIADEAGSEAGYTGDQGSVIVDGPGTVMLDATNSFDGGIYISAGKLVLGAAGAAGGGDIVFTNNLVVDPTVSFTVADTPAETIVNFGKGDVLDITDLNFSGATIQDFTSNGSGGGTLEIIGDQTGTGTPETLTLTFSNYDGTFRLIQDAGGGTEVVPICYVRGTNILTPTGNVQVESLKIGDLLVTRFGGIRPVKWIGRQSYDVRMLRNSPEKCPVRIRAGALADGMPARDLLVSPGHAILVENTLVLASHLANGVTVLHEQITADIGKLDYYQIEFATHDCVIAEGAWAESYADAPGLRAQFQNAADFYARYPDDAPPEALTLCAPRPERGTKLESALLPVVSRAAITPGALEGYIDSIDAWHIQGWALDTEHPELPVLLDILLNGEKLGTALACHHREDLAAAGKNSGRCAFTFKAPRRLPPDAVNHLTIRRAADGANLPFAQQPARIVA